MKKKILKKATAALLAAVVFTSACASQSTGNAEQNETSVSESDTEKADKSSSDESLPAFDKSGTIAESTIYDQDGVTITAKSLTYTDDAAVVLLDLSNGTDKDLTFVSGSMGYSANSINGYMVDDGFVNVDVTPGNHAQETMEFDLQTLQIYGINAIADMKVSFEIEDADNNSTYTGSLDLPTSLADKVDTSGDPYQSTIVSDAALNTVQMKMLAFSNEEPVQAGDLTVLSEAMLELENGQTGVLLEVRNDGSEYRYVGVDGITVNGLKVCSRNWTGDIITPGCTALVDITMDDVLSEAGRTQLSMKEFGSLGFHLTVYASDYDTELATAQVQIENPDADASWKDDGAELYNDGGIVIRSAGRPFEDEDDNLYAHLYFIVQNNSGSDISITDSYEDAFALNTLMTDYLMYSVRLNDGEIGLVDLEINLDELETNGLSDLSSVTSADMRFTLDFGEDEKDIDIHAEYK